MKTQYMKTCRHVGELNIKNRNIKRNKYLAGISTEHKKSKNYTHDRNRSKQKQ